jgi:hypothetical protein
MNKLKLFMRVVSSLMLVAFVVGLVAFVKANKSGELNTLYKEEPNTVKEKNEKIDAEDFSRAEINPAPTETTIVKMDSLPENATMPIAEKKVIKKKNTKKKYFNKKDRKNISLKSFSRGSLVPIEKVVQATK